MFLSVLIIDVNYFELLGQDQLFTNPLLNILAMLIAAIFSSIMNEVVGSVTLLEMAVMDVVTNQPQTNTPKCFTFIDSGHGKVRPLLGFYDVV